MAKTAIATSLIERGMFLTRVPRLFGEVRDGLDPGVGDHRDRDREEEVLPGRRDAEVDVRGQDVRAEDEHEAHDTSSTCVAKSMTREHDVELADSWMPTMFKATSRTITMPPPTMSHGFCRSGPQKIER